MKKMAVAFQGAVAGYGHKAATEFFPDAALESYFNFSDTLNAVEVGKADYAIIPVENAIAGRVADVHNLFQECSLYIVGEHFLQIDHCLLGLKGADIKSLRQVFSHEQALFQCSRFIKENRITPIPKSNTAIAAREVVEMADITIGAIASREAAQKYGLEIIEDSIANKKNNCTRFLVFSRQQSNISDDAQQCVASLSFEVSAEPGTLVEALDVFRRNNIRMSRIESCISFTEERSPFLVDLELRATQVEKVIDDLKRVTCQDVRVFGIYPMASFRCQIGPSLNHSDLFITPGSTLAGP